MSVPAPIRVRGAEPGPHRLFPGARAATGGSGQAADGAHSVSGDADAADKASDPIDSWLDVLGSMLDLPSRERDAIREELGGHLRERVRDLVLGGRSEHDAVSVAIGELGDAAALARRFREATNAPRRRMLMHTAVFGLAGAAMITSLIALRGGQPGATTSVFQAPESRAESLRVSVDADSTWESFFERAGEAAGKPVYVHWNHVRTIEGEQGPVAPDGFVGVRAENFTLARTVEIINDQMNLPKDQGVDFRVIDGRLEFSTVAYFDERETTLATFDLAPVIESRRATQEDATASSVLEEATSVIHSLVHPDLWTNNGGDRATLTAFDTRLFIRAPRRIMPEVEWVIGEMSKGAEVARAGEGERVAVKGGGR